MYNIPAEKRKSFVMLLKQDKRNKNTLIKNVRCLLWQPYKQMMPAGTTPELDFGP